MNINRIQDNGNGDFEIISEYVSEHQKIKDGVTCCACFWYGKNMTRGTPCDWCIRNRINRLCPQHGDVDNFVDRRLY